MDDKTRLINKLCSVQTDANFAGIIDALLDVRPRRTVPEIAELAIAPPQLNHLVMARLHGQRDFLATMLDRPLLEKNLIRIARRVGLSKQEQQYLLQEVDGLQVKASS